MKKESKAKNLRWILVGFVIFGLAAAMIILPGQFQTEAGNQYDTGDGLIPRTVSHEDGIDNYDIREHKSEEVAESLLKYRLEAGKNAAAIADIRTNFVRGEDELRTRVPSLKIEYNTGMRIPEVISPDVWKTKIERLTGIASGKNADTLRNFAKQNNQLIGMDIDQINQLKEIADYTNPSGSMAFAHFLQEINGIPVFGGDIKAGFTTRGEMMRVINNLAPGLDYRSLSTDFRDPVDAVKAAFRYVNTETRKFDTEINNAASTDLRRVFGTGDSATTAEKMYFPTEPGVARAAWRVLIIKPVSGYYVVVDAETGKMLWRKNISNDQTQAATYEVYPNLNAFLPAQDSPAPLSPGPLDPTTGTQGAIIPARTSRSLIGTENGNPGMNNLGWMTDGTNVTDGNNVEAGIDRVAPDGIDATQPGDGPCPGAGCRTFTSTWNPPPGNPPPGDAPLTAPAQRGAVVQMFYVMNLHHDIMYNLGWTEQAFNMQNDNFGRGGAGGDRVRAEAQDSSGTNNANMLTPADGGRGRMQMFLWTGPTPDYDGTTDAEVIIHEISHSLSNRLHGNTTGLTGNMAGGMGEGWGDWYAYTMLAEPTDPINGIYTTGGYATFLAAAGFMSNYYHGIRKFPRAPITFTGGPSNLPHNPLTFRYLNVGCAALIGTTTAAVNSAYPRGPFGVAQCDQVHNAGEVWSSALWEVRNRMVTRLGFTPGTRRVLQVVTDGMKLAPTGPTFLSERDAIIMAASALPAVPEASLDVADVREGFRVRGMGFSASIQTPSPAAVTEAFDFPNVSHVNPFTVSDAPGDNDGFPEPGENLLLGIAVSNSTGGTVTNVMVNVSGGTNVSFGNMNDGQTVTMNIPYTVPGGATCGAFHQVQINVSSDVGMQAPVNRQFRLGAPVGGPPTTFMNTTQIDLPAGQPGTTAGPGTPYPSNISVSGLTGNKVIRVEFTSVTHTFPADLDFLLVSPSGAKYILLSDSGGGGDVSALTFTLSDGAAAQPSTAQWVAGDFRPYNTGANDVFDPPAPAGPYLNAAPAGTDTLLSSYGMNGSTMNGTWSLYSDDDAGADSGFMAGWKLTFESDDYVCSLAPGSARADFDGDGRTDLSIFRPTEGNWYINGSTSGFNVINWGVASDTLVPADYDGDGKADTAVFRPVDAPGTPDYFILNSNGFTVSGAEWGKTGDISVTGDYDGDGKADLAVFRPSDGTWYILNSSNGSNTIEPFGQNGDIPVPLDSNGDGKLNLAVFRPANNTWYIARATGVPAQNFDAIPFGLTGDIFVPGDYDGDNKDDVAVFRPSTGRWFILQSTNNVTLTIPFGTMNDRPVPGDYNGDGKEDIAVYRNGTWWIRDSTSGNISASNFGVASDTAVVSRANP